MSNLEENKLEQAEPKISNDTKSSDLTDITLDVTESTKLNNDEIIEEIHTNSNNCFDYIKNLQEDQDFMQKVNVATTLLLEIYRVLMGAFLVLFVPQKCGEHICDFNENLNKSDIIDIVGLSSNLVTFLNFLILYFIEVKRENKLITYLEVNRFEPVDNESVGEALEKLDEKRRKKILDYDHYYYNVGKTATITFTANTILSIIVVLKSYLNNTTIIVLLTNVLFMGLKVNEVYSIVNTKKNVFYSAYLTNKVQYNDVDPDKLKSKEEVIENDIADDIKSDDKNVNKEETKENIEEV
tara:strand:+ start:1824 stop:2714 length:891 start_codon:yes stop_codon:yes gene_type:complete